MSQFLITGFVPTVGTKGVSEKTGRPGFNPYRKIKWNKVEFLSKVCTVTNLVTGEVVLVAKRNKNIYVADFESLQAGDMRCLKLVDDDTTLWHGRLGHASFSLLNKLIQKDLVRGLTNSRFTCTLVLRKKDGAFEVILWTGKTLLEWFTCHDHVSSLGAQGSKTQWLYFGVFSDGMPLLCDNTGALNLIKNPVQNKRTKHIEVKPYLLRVNVEKGLICAKSCSTENQIPDLFTKALSREHFGRNKVKLGLLKSNGESDSPSVVYALGSCTKVFPFLSNPVSLLCIENLMSRHSSDLIKEYLGGFTSQVLEVSEDDPDQYLNSSNLDLMALTESTEKETAHNIMAIAAESLMNEGEHLLSEYQGEETPFLGNVRTIVLLESLAHETVIEKPVEEPDSLLGKPTPAPLDHPKLLESSSKSPTIKLQQKEGFESTLQKSRRSVKTRKKRLIDQGKFVTDKSVPVGGVDKIVLKEPGSLVEQSIKAQKSMDEASDEAIEKQNGAYVKGINKSKKSPVEQAIMSMKSHSKILAAFVQALLLILRSESNAKQPFKKVDSSFRRIPPSRWNPIQNK
uniref:Uncharacterized protein LOC104245514 n=1 Tax=Nicotiana sylvestris TaxID=4096 RepID=A0A1U7Y5N2_NICSY|nr:PREDICTED: uncharacterized protein LOC104245514 [Nicotiana sylvestris]